MVDKDIHIRIPQELFEELSQFKEKEKMNTNSKAIVEIMNRYFHHPMIQLVEPNVQDSIEQNAMVKSQELHIFSLKQELEHCKEQIKIKDQQIIGLIGAQGQISTQMQSIVAKLEAPKKKHWWNF